MKKMAHSIAISLFLAITLTQQSFATGTLSQREIGSLILAPLVLNADIHFGLDNQLHVKIGVASYADRENADIILAIYDSSGKSVSQTTYSDYKITQQTGGFDGAGYFKGDDGSRNEQNLLTITTSLSLARGNVSTARVFFKNKSACKLFGDTSTVCSAFSAYIANISSIGQANSLQAGDIRRIHIDSSTSY